MNKRMMAYNGKLTYYGRKVVNARRRRNKAARASRKRNRA